MQQPPVRLAVMALLLTSSLAAAYILWTIDQRVDAGVVAQEDILARLARMSETVAGIGASEQSYVAPGQLDGPWFERTATLMDQLSADIEHARASPRSSGAAEAVQALAGSTEALREVDTRTRRNLGLGREMLAADVLFSDGRNLLDAMTASLRDLRAAEQAFHRADLSALSRRRWIVFATASLIWVAGLLALVAIPASPSASATARLPADVRPRAAAETPTKRLARMEQRPSIDLASAASLCTDLSRVTTTDALSGLLRRAALVLDASGVMLWITAGEQLFPMMGHGYGQDTLARLRPLTRDADNAAADAWRTGQLTVVAAPGPAENGAIVAPLFGLDACIGVLAVEIRHGAEYNLATQAVVTMIAAQLATVVPAWPTGNLTDPAGTTESVEPPVTIGEATRQARSA